MFFVDNDNAQGKKSQYRVWSLLITWADLGSGGCNPPNGLSHSIKCSTTEVLSHADALVYIAKSLVVVVHGHVLDKL